MLMNDGVSLMKHYNKLLLITFLISSQLSIFMQFILKRGGKKKRKNCKRGDTWKGIYII